MAYEKCFECYDWIDFENSEEQPYEFYPKFFCSPECVCKHLLYLSEKFNEMYHEREALIRENSKLRIDAGDYSPYRPKKGK